MNRMADVAALLNKKMGEEFRINIEDVFTCRAKFTVGGLMVDFEEGYGYLENAKFEHDLLIGRAVIVDD